MTKSFIVASLFTLAIALVLAACGGKEGKEIENQVAPTDAGQTTDTPISIPNEGKNVGGNFRDNVIGVWNIVPSNGNMGDICAFSFDKSVYCIENSLGWFTYDVVDNDRLFVGSDRMDIRESGQDRLVLEDENAVAYLFTRIEPSVSGLKDLLAGTWISDAGDGIYYFDGSSGTAIINDHAVQYDVLGEAVIVASLASLPGENETMLVEEITDDKLTLRTAGNTKVTMNKHNGTGGSSILSSAGTWILVWDGEHSGELYMDSMCELILEDVTYECEILSDEVIVLTEADNPTTKYALALEAISSDEIIVRTGKDDTLAYLIREGTDGADELASPPTARTPFSVTSSNANDLELLWEMRLPGQVLEVSPDGNLLAVAGRGDLVLLDFVTGEELWTVSNRLGIGSLVFNQSGEVLAIQSANGSQTRIFDVATGSEVYSVEDTWGRIVPLPNSGILAFAIHTYQNGSYRDGLVFWDAVTRSQQFFPFNDVVEVLAANSDGTMIALSTGDLWDVQSRAVKGRVPGVRRKLSAAYFDQQGANLVIVEEGDTKVIGLSDMAIKYTIAAAKPFMNSAKTQFAYTIYTGDIAIRLVDIDSGVERSFQQVMPADSFEFVFSPDDTVLVAVGSRTWVWSAETGNNLVVLDGPSFAPRNGRFAQDGKVLVVSGGQEVMTFVTHSVPVDQGRDSAQVTTQIETSQPGQQSGRIVFQTGDLQSNGQLEIAVVNPDGTGFSLLTNNRGMSNSNPRWSPDGRQIAFQSDRDGNPEIYVMNADGSQQTRLTSNRAFDGWPRWSNDGKIIFMSDRDGVTQPYVMDSDGGNQTRLTDEDFSATLSPDGSMKAFVNQEDAFENWEIYVSDVDGTSIRRLTDNSYADYWPTWSADGLLIFFLSTRDGWSQLYKMSVDGGEAVNISNTFQNVYDYALSSDGSQIAFSDHSKLYLVNSDGTGLRIYDIPSALLDWR